MGEASPREVCEARFQKLFEDADAMSIQGYTPDGTVVYWNRASEKIYGYTAAQALGGNLLDLIIPPAARQEVAGAMRQMFETGQGIPAGRLNLLHRDGHTVPVYSSHTVVALPGQTPVLFCMDTDMSELARAEVELRVAAIAFETQQGMFITDARGTVLRINRALARITGLQAGQVVGRSIRRLRTCHHPARFYADLWRSLLQAGRWEGEVASWRSDGKTGTDWITLTAVRDPQGQVTHYVGALTDMTQREEARAEILRLALHDPLTHLPNRRLLMDRLQQELATSQRKHSGGALLFIDLDHFKMLNDTLGHALGDLLLQQVGQRLSACVRETDTVAHLGSDEFVVMLGDLSASQIEAAAQAEGVGRKLLTALSQPCTLGTQAYTGSASIGIVLFPGSHDSGEVLMQQADLAMCEAKAAGRQTLRFFDPQMQAAVTRHAALLNDLREGLSQGQFLLYYQPQVDHDGRIAGFEALVRWQHPVRGLVPPDEFIPAAEESGLIRPLGLWILESACTQLAAWATQPQTAPLTLAVNVSAVQFARPDFVGQVLGVLQRTGANPRRLKLELTESLLVHKVDEVIAKMDALKVQGVGFSLDDFGTGYSSLRYLQRLPLDQLKIDQSFVQSLQRDTHSAAIAQTIITLGHTMGLSVIAEGVETPAQQALLAQLGCTAYQGYLFSRPLALAQVQALLAQQGAPPADLMN
jgi:diguanylate cyclase (GGDEF)-like protein/PAS domain S-box-containing protein